jgi:transposase
MEQLASHQARHQQFLQLHQLLSTYSGLYAKTRQELVEYKTKANFWETQFHKLKTREENTKTELAELKAQLRKREQQLFGRKSESKKSLESTKPRSKRKRGQQPGKAGHGRRDYSELPSVEEEIDLVEQDKCCPCCGLPYEELSGTEDSEILEIINVKAYKRTIKRKKYRRACTCQGNKKSQIITAPTAERLLPKSKFGISVWAYLLLQKYEYQQPLYRGLKQLKANGLPLAIGTVTDGFRKLLPYVTPAYDAIVNRSLSAKHWHADETGWKVFEAIEGKTNSRWYLWIFSNNETVVYKLHPSRSSQVLIEHFGEESSGTLNVDRYAAYKVIAKTGLFILAFCWAHVRRDFLDYSKGYPYKEDWGLAWVERIGKLYELNNKRIRYQQDTKMFQKYDKKLKDKIGGFRKTLDEQLKDEMVLPSGKKLLKSLDKHWSGLTIFVDRPEIPMDNNKAERGLRSSVVGRKNYYGSSAIWSGELAAAMFTILETVKRWKMNPHTWLLAYLQACAMSNGSPKEVEKFMPWNMTDQQRLAFSQPPAGEDTS